MHSNPTQILLDKITKTQIKEIANVTISIPTTVKE
jgi:hypothetical protein